jgi:hypothetical protein
VFHRDPCNIRSVVAPARFGNRQAAAVPAGGERGSCGIAGKAAVGTWPGGLSMTIADIIASSYSAPTTNVLGQF